MRCPSCWSFKTLPPDSERDAMAGSGVVGKPRPRSPFPGGWSHRFSCLRLARPFRRHASRSCRWRTGTQRREDGDQGGVQAFVEDQGAFGPVHSYHGVSQGFYRPGHHTCDDEQGYFSPRTQPARYISPNLETSYQGCYFSCQDDKENAGPKLQGGIAQRLPHSGHCHHGLPKECTEICGTVKSVKSTLG